MNKKQSGQMLGIALIVLSLIMVLIIPLVQLIRQESIWTVAERQKTIAFHLAEAGIDRGIWKLKQSTSTFATAERGDMIANYNFDKTFNDLEGGYYRIKFSSGPDEKEVTIDAEGKDTRNKETRAIKCVVKNTAIPGAIISGGNIDMSGIFEVHWGPIMSLGNIALSGGAATDYYPRKFSKQVVTGTVGQARDENGLDPPNTDGIEWWSDYDVPDLPVPDFAAMRSSAEATGTLNYYRNLNGTEYDVYINGEGTPTAKPYLYGTNRVTHNGDKPISVGGTGIDISKMNYTWYWDEDVDIVGPSSYGDIDANGLYGTIVVRGNLSQNTGDYYCFIAKVPADAWKEYQKIDTAQLNQYPADNGLHENRPTFGFGTEGYLGCPAGQTPVGFRGFIYVGEDFTINAHGTAEYYGAIWVNGEIETFTGDRASLFFCDDLVIPALNVVLVRQSWKEVSPTDITWVTP
ncbi:MAG: hypothetical protein JW983_07215 [Elusimicrobia bacterium]|nr:hypothetical protein [Elusimicrobiota bacterium]